MSPHEQQSTLCFPQKKKVTSNGAKVATSTSNGGVAAKEEAKSKSDIVIKEQQTAATSSPPADVQSTGGKAPRKQSAPVKKSHHYRPGTGARQWIRNRTFVCNVSEQIMLGVHFDRGTVDALPQASKAYLIELFKACEMSRCLENRETIILKDLQLAHRMLHKKLSRCLENRETLKALQLASRMLHKKQP